MGNFWKGAANAIPLVGPVIGAAIGANQSRKNVKDTIAHQRYMQEYEWNKNLEMWNMQNLYNTPSAQMQRFKDAGLNPHLIYGQGSSGNAQTLPKYSAARPDYAGRQNVSGRALSALGTYQDIKMKNTQIDNLRAQTELTDQKRLTENMNTALKTADSKMRSELAKYSFQLARNQSVLSWRDTEKRLMEMENLGWEGQLKELGVQSKSIELQWLNAMKASGIVGQSIVPFLRILLNMR